MAVTKIHAIKSTLNKALEYIENPEKTDGQMLVSGYNVDPLVASTEFEMTASLAREVKGNYSKTGGTNNLAYHMIQSFSPTDNVTKEQAHEIGKKLADEFLDGKYEYVVSTHIDKGQIHNHIIFNSVSFYDYKKFRTQPYKTAAQIRNISDRLCAENELSIITERKSVAKQYSDYKKIKRSSWRSEIRKKLNYLLEFSTDYEQFKINAKELGVTVNDTGKHISYLYEGQQRPTRGNKLSDTEKYTNIGITEQISANKETQKHLKTAIKETAEQSSDFEQFSALLKQNFDIKYTQRKNGEVVYRLRDSSVKEIFLGENYSTENIKSAIKSNSFSFDENNKTFDVTQKYYDSTRKLVDTNDTEIVLSNKNISKVTEDGILINVPNLNHKNSKIFISQDHVKFDEKNDKFCIKIGSKFDYYFSDENSSSDTPLPPQFIKGEDLIRAVELQNNLKPITVKLSADDIKCLSPKGVTISSPDKDIERLFIPNEYVSYNRAESSCSIEVYPNWNYSHYKTIDEKTTALSMTGNDLISNLKDRVSTQSLEPKLARLQRRMTITDTKMLAATMLLMREEKLTKISDFDNLIKDYKERASELTAGIKNIETKISGYRAAQKYLIGFNEHLSVKQKLETLSGKQKTRFAAIHKSELLAFEYAIEQLNRMGVNSNVDPDKVNNLIREQENKVSDLKSSIKGIESQISSITEKKNKLQDTINDTEKTKKTQTQSQEL